MSEALEKPNLPPALPSTLAPQGFFVIASYMMIEPQLGCSCHFNLIPVPWTHDELVSAVADMVNQEIYQHENIVCEQTEIVDLYRDELSRGFGLRFWQIADPKKCALLMKLYRDRFSSPEDSEIDEAIKLIDALSFLDADVEHRFDGIEINIDKAIVDVEQRLIAHLQSDIVGAADGPNIKSTWAPLGIDVESMDEWKLKNTNLFASDNAEKLAYLNHLYAQRADQVSRSPLGDCCPLAKEVRLACDQLTVTGCSGYADRLIRGERLAVNLHDEYVLKTKCYGSPRSAHNQFDADESIDDYDYDYDYEDDVDPADFDGVCCIRHGYDIGDQNIYLKAGETSPDPIRAAIYCQFKCEEWFGHEKMLSNLGVGALLVQFYGFTHHSRTDALDVCMHNWREHFTLTERYEELMGDITLTRVGLKEVLKTHLRR